MFRRIANFLISLKLEDFRHRFVYIAKLHIIEHRDIDYRFILCIQDIDAFRNDNKYFDGLATTPPCLCPS
jgi:hypothetical protein